MDNFEKAFAYTMKYEDALLSGSVTMDTNGALVRYGVNAKSHPELLATGFYDRINVSDAAALVVAKDIARRQYWLPTRCDKINNVPIAVKTFDRAYESGVHEAGVLLQRAAGLFGFDLVVDGVVGSATIAAVNLCPPEEFLNKLRLLNRAFIASWWSRQTDIPSRVYSAVLARASA